MPSTEEQSLSRVDAFRRESGRESSFHSRTAAVEITAPRGLVFAFVFLTFFSYLVFLSDSFVFPLPL
jgi:hypothetical protein